jgi:hypothetical protein
MAGKFRVFSAVAIMPALAVCAALASTSTVLTRGLPDRAASIPIVDADAYAARAMAAMTGADTSKFGNLKQQARADGVRTFDAEPTNSSAVSLMAVSAQLDGNNPRARALYKDALEISKRDRAANLWLIEDASANGRIGDALDRYDVLLRTGGAASDALFDVLGTALREDAIVPHLEARLAQRPPWAEQFWLRVAPRGAAIGNIGRLRLRLLDKGIANPAHNDGELVRRLVGSGEFDLAYELFRRVPKQKQPADDLARNADFSAPPRFSPFDWELLTGSGFGAEIEPGSGVLAVYTEDGIDTLVARQLIASRSGPHELTYRVRNPEALGALRTTLRVRCQGGGAATLTSVTLAGAAGREKLTMPASGCRYAWIEVWARKDAPRSDSIDDVLLDRVALRRAS